jgi:transcriptional regulator with XRE-family HTH domain
MMNDIEIKEVGKRLKYLREKRGESQEKLGESLSISQKAISNYEKGITPLPIDVQLKYAEHYNVSHDYLCTGRDNESILKLLEKYISLKYVNTSTGIESFVYPVLQINKIYFDYLVHTATAENTKGVPDTARQLWIETEITTFYERNKDNTFTENESIVPLPQQLIYPDDNKAYWKQSDLLREMNKQLLDYSNTKNR